MIFFFEESLIDQEQLVNDVAYRFRVRLAGIRLQDLTNYPVESLRLGISFVEVPTEHSEKQLHCLPEDFIVLH